MVAAEVGGQLRRDALRLLDLHWRPPGYACPNPQRYPWQWLWDSCFHAVTWAHLGDERALVELATVFAGQDPASGFVPHVAYWGDVDHHADFWGRSGFSSITQPPMYGHAVAELGRLGIEVEAETVERAAAGLWFLLRDRRRSPGGLVELAHPWESGADDSPRWDDLAGGPFDLVTWRRRKGELVEAIERDAVGAPIGNADTAVASIAFASLVAFNAAELAGVTGDSALAAAAVELSEAIGARWDEAAITWVDDGPTASGSGRTRTVEGLLGALVDPDRVHVDAALDLLVDPSAHGAPFGPTGVHRDEPCFAPATYWRGPAWPQLTYLLWVAARRARRTDIATALAVALVDGAVTSGFAEYWQPDSGQGLGAIPQSWATLAVVAADDLERDGVSAGA